MQYILIAGRTAAQLKFLPAAWVCVAHKRWTSMARNPMVQFSIIRTLSSLRGYPLTNNLLVIRKSFVEFGKIYIWAATINS